MSHNKFTSIESFAHVYRSQQRFTAPALVEYGAKIKLHGTNAAIRIENTAESHLPVAQGRNRDLFVGEDQFGFAGWVAANQQAWSNFAMDFTVNMGEAWDTVTVHGEWAGPGIQKKDAVSKLSQKYFFVFAVQIGDRMFTEPKHIEAVIPDLDQVLVLPWFFEEPKTVNFANAEMCDIFAREASRQAELIGERDPFIDEIFGIAEPGEGLVYVPMGHGVPRDMYGSLVFKAKTADHGGKAGPSVVRELVVPEGTDDFVKTFVTQARCEQAVMEGCGGEAVLENTGKFLGWIGKDVMKESVEELADMGVEWKAIQKHVIAAAKLWFRAEATKIV